MQKKFFASLLSLLLAGSSFAADFTKEISGVQDLCIFTQEGTVYNGDPNAFSTFLGGVHVEKVAGTFCGYNDTYTDGNGHFAVSVFTETQIIMFSKAGFQGDVSISNGVDPDTPIIMTLFPE